MRLFIYMLFLCMTGSLFAAELIEPPKIKLSVEEKNYLREHSPLRVQNLSTLPPFNFTEKGRPVGYTVDYIRLMGRYIGTEIEFVSGKTWGEYLEMLKKGSLDIIPHIAVTKERKEFVDFTSFNHIGYATGIAVLKESSIYSMADLKDKIIAVANKTFLHTHLKNNFPNQSLLLTASTSKAVEAVSLGKADAVIGSLPALDYYIQKDWLSNVKTISINDMKLPSMTELPMGVAKGNDILLGILEKAHETISHQEVASLRQKWMDVKLEPTDEIVFSDEERAYLEKKKEIKLCVNPDWMPFEEIDKGKHKGMIADYFEIFKKQLSIPVTLVETKNLFESITLAKNRQCDVISILGNSEENSRFFNFTTSLIDTSIVIVTKIDVPFITNIPSITDKKIGVLKDCVCEMTLRAKYPKMKLVSISSTEEGLEKVSQRELFGFIGALPVVAPPLQKNFIGDVKVAGRFEQGWGFSMAVRNDEPELLTITNKLIKNISPKQHQEIMDRWNTLNIQSNIDYSKLIYTSLFFLIIILIILYKNRSIKQMNKELSFAHREIQEQQEMVDKYVLILETDLEGVITDVNNAYCRALGYSPKDLIGKTHEMMRHPNMKKEFFSEMWENLFQDKAWSGEILNYAKDRNNKWFNAYIEPIFRENIKIGYRAICEDVTDKKRVEELSMTDKLTGIHNRMKLDELIVKQVATFKRYKTPFSIVLLDIDDFKAINDTYGHDIGDKVLKDLARLLKKNIRVTDLVGRWGGEEFLLIFPNTIAKNAFIVAENIRFLIEQESFDKVGKMTVSLGIAEFKDTHSVTSIFKHADSALYEAKKGGKNQTVLNT